MAVCVVQSSMNCLISINSHNSYLLFYAVHMQFACVVIQGATPL
jgi:hypothetical protein